MKKTITILVFLLVHAHCFSQTIMIGVVDAESSSPLIGAKVMVLQTSQGGLTDQTGHVMLDDLRYPLSLELSYVGYKTDTVQLLEPTSSMTMYSLQRADDLDAVIVEGRDMATDIDPLAAGQLELIGAKELLKAACCNLSESFENSATIDVSYNDAVTGSKQISMLGLAGVYSQINWENMPLVRGLSEYYGLNFVPGPWIESIQVGKGAGSVVNGYESMTGQINVEFFKPDDMPKFYLNGYQNIQGRSELNAFAGKELDEKWSTALFVHADLITGEVDDNDDGFVDRNQGGQINIFNRWKYVSQGNYRSQFGFKFLHDQQLGGQVGFEANTPSNLYGIDVESNRVEGFMKHGFIFPEQPWKSVGLIVNGASHEQNGLFGTQQLNSDHKSLYANFILQTMINNTQHTVKTGANLQLDRFNETVNTIQSDRNYTVPGLFAEYDYDNVKNLKIVAGLRADYVNVTSDIEFSPRIHFKWNTDGENAIRVSAGRGFRVPNLFADSPGMLASNREVVLVEIPDIESSWNMGASLTRYFKLNGKEATFVTDFYRTTFENQLIRDFYASPNHVFISNLAGKSYANSFQTSLDAELFTRFEVRMAYKRDDVKQDILGERVERQLTPKHRGLLNLAYATNYERWIFDLTSQYVGEQRLPTTARTVDGLYTPHYSDDFVKLNAQITTNYKDWELYAGGENLGGFTQNNPIVAPENPFGNNFDASSVWGPIMGANVYLGFRFTIEK